MKLFGTKRRKITGGTVGLLIVAAIAVGTALAYYGGQGTGTASANAGHSPRSVTISPVGVPQTLYPGDLQVEIDFEVASSQGNVHVGSVSLDTSQGDQGIGGLPVGCDRSWFSFTPPDPGDFPAGANVLPGSPLSLASALDFTESGTDQSACSDASLTLYLQAAPN